MSKEVKQIRGQVRQVALELIPEILNEELYKQLERRVMTELSRRCDILEQNQKNFHGYVIRQSAPKVGK